MKFRAKTDEQRKLVVNWDQVNMYLSRRKPGTLFEIEIKPWERKISDPMRKMYFGHILPTFMEYLGYDKDEQDIFHRQLKIVYFQIKPDKKGIYRNVPSVFGNDSDLPISEKTKFVEWVLRKAAIEGCYIEMDKPDPGEK